jgi:hypothetical protein
VADDHWTGCLICADRLIAVAAADASAEMEANSSESEKEPQQDVSMDVMMRALAASIKNPARGSRSR